MNFAEVYDEAIKLIPHRFREDFTKKIDIDGDQKTSDEFDRYLDINEDAQTAICMVLVAYEEHIKKTCRELGYEGTISLTDLLDGSLDIKCRDSSDE